jgi:hypothetical protein
MDVGIATRYVDEEDQLTQSVTSMANSAATDPRGRRASREGPPLRAASLRPPSVGTKLEAAAPAAAERAVAAMGASDVAPELSALSKQFLSDLAATHHQAEFADKRESQRSYTAKMKALLAEELAEDDPETEDYFTGDTNVSLRRSVAHPTAPPPPSPTAVLRKQLIEQRMQLGERMRRLGFDVPDPDVSFVGIGSRGRDV